MSGGTSCVLCLVVQGVCMHSVWWCVQCPVVQIMCARSAVSGGARHVRAVSGGVCSVL